MPNPTRAVYTCVTCGRVSRPLVHLPLGWVILATPSGPVLQCMNCQDAAEAAYTAEMDAYVADDPGPWPDVEYHFSVTVGADGAEVSCNLAGASWTVNHDPDAEAGSSPWGVQIPGRDEAVVVESLDAGIVYALSHLAAGVLDGSLIDIPEPPER